MALPVGLDRGDAFANLYAAYAPRVAGLARRFASSPDVVDDIVQETLLRAYRAGLHLEDGEDPWPWMATVARNLCHDLHRRGFGRETALEKSNVVALVPGPERSVEDRARAAYVERALGALPSRQRDLLVLHHMEDMPCTEIAAAQETSVDAVKSALARAREGFRARYEGWRGLVPQVLMPMVAKARDAAARALAAPLPALRSAAAAVLAAVLALGLAPSSTASGRSDQRARRPGLPQSTEHNQFAGGASTASPMPVGGRLISFQPPESPDAPPTPASSPPPRVAAVPPTNDSGGLTSVVSHVVPLVDGVTSDVGAPAQPAGPDLAAVTTAVETLVSAVSQFQSALSSVSIG